MTAERGHAWYETGSDNPTRMRWAIEYDGRCIGSCDLRGTGNARRYAIAIGFARVLNRSIARSNREVRARASTSATT